MSNVLVPVRIHYHVLVCETEPAREPGAWVGSFLLVSYSYVWLQPVRHSAEQPHLPRLAFGARGRYLYLFAHLYVAPGRSIRYLLAHMYEYEYEVRKPSMQRLRVGESSATNLVNQNTGRPCNIWSVSPPAHASLPQHGPWIPRTDPGPLPRAPGAWASPALPQRVLHLHFFSRLLSLLPLLVLPFALRPSFL